VYVGRDEKYFHIPITYCNWNILIQYSVRGYQNGKSFKNTTSSKCHFWGLCENLLMLPANRQHTISEFTIMTEQKSQFFKLSLLLSLVEKTYLNNNNNNNNHHHHHPIYYLSHAFNNSFPNINLKFTTTKEIENIIKSVVQSCLLGCTAV
jgi:hypothetical protein